MPSTAAKPRQKQRRRRRDGEDDDDEQSDVSRGSGSESDASDEAGHESESESEDGEEEDVKDSVPVHEIAADEPIEQVSFEEFNAEQVASQSTPHVRQSDATASSDPKPQDTTSTAPRPRPASNRAAYLAKMAADPTFVPRVGKFWTHDERHYAAGRVGQGGSEYAGLREMSEFWRDRGRGRGRGRGGFVRGRGRGMAVGVAAVVPHKEVEAPTQSDAQLDVSTDPSAVPPVPSAVPPVDQSPGPKSTWNGNVGRSDRGSWSHDGYAELAREEEQRSAARERQQMMARGRGRGMVRGMFRGRGRHVGPVTDRPIQHPAETSAPESADTTAPLPQPGDNAKPVVKLPGSDSSPLNPPFSDHEPSAITAHLQTQAEHAERLQQQELKRKQQTAALEDDMKRLEIERVASTGVTSSDAGSHSSAPHPPPPHNMLPPGIGVTETGAFYDIATGQAVVWVPSPSPGPAQPPMAPGGSRMGYNPYGPEMGSPYAYPPQFAGYQQPYSAYPRQPHLADPYAPYPPSFGRDSASPYPMHSYGMHAPPHLGDPSYFMPPRPQSKIQIRAPAGDAGEPSAVRHPNSAEIAAATLKDPSKHVPRSPPNPSTFSPQNAYQYQPMDGQYMPNAQQGYYPQQYMPMGY